MKKLAALIISATLLAACTPSANKPIGPAPKVSDKDESQAFNIFGGAKFETTVKGYLKVLEEEGFGGKTKAAYLAITTFQDEGFQKSIEIGIKEGNSINKKSGNEYLFNLGCLKDDKIDGRAYAELKPYIDNETQQALIKSSKDKPVSVKLQFGLHEGTECTCCNLAHSIRLM